MMDLIWLKNVTSSDREFLRSIRNDCRHEFFDCEYITEEKHKQWFDALLKSQSKFTSEFFIIMNENNDRLGSISIDYSQGEIGNVIVINNYHRKGVGTRAMKIAISMLKSKRPRVTPFIQVKHGNVGAFLFYKLLGFKPTRTIMELKEK